MNDGLFVRWGAKRNPLWVAPAWPEGFTMNLRITITVKLEIVASVTGLAALLWFFS